MNVVLHPLSRSILALPLAGALTLSAVAQTTPSDTATSNSQQSAYRDSIAQETVRKQTGEIQAEITNLLAELNLNGLDTSDTRFLSNAVDHLQSLSQQDMQKVINMLQSASITSQDDERQKNMVSAFQGQKNVSLQLKTLGQALAAQEAQKEIPSKLEDLIARQSANIRKTSVIVSSDPGHLSDQQKSVHDVVSAEQSSIGGEINLLCAAVAAKSTDTADASTQAVTTALGQILNNSMLKDTAQTAIQLTSSGPFPDGLQKQKSVRDYLTTALRAASAATDRVAQLQQSKARLERLIDDQKELADVSKQGEIDHSTLAERQNKIDDRTAVAQSLIKPISTDAAAQLDQAQQAMAQSSDTLGKTKNTADAAPQQQAVVDALKKADDLLDQQIAAAQKDQAMSPADKLAELQRLQNEIDQAAKNPQKTAADLDQIKQDASNPSPQAADQIAQAQDQLQQSQADTNAANQALDQASKDVQQQEDAVKQSAQDYQQLQQAQQALDQAQQQAQAADQSIQSTPNSLTDAAHDLNQAQTDVSQAQQAAQQSDASADAKQAMQDASDALKDATTQAVQAQGAGAQAQDKKAMAAIQKAQQGLAQAMAAAQAAGQQALGGQGQEMAQGQGQMPGQGQGQMPGQGQGQSQGQGQGQSQGLGQGTGFSPTSHPSPNSGGLLAGAGPAGGPGLVMGGLKPKDRDAISQYQAEKSPPEYAPLVQQYLKNLADSSESH